MINGLEIISENNTIYAIIVRHGAQSEKKHNFLTQTSEPFQLGVSFYRSGDEVKAHYHLSVLRHIDRTCEFVVIDHGSASMRVFDDAHSLLGTWKLMAGDMVLLLRGGHGFVCEEDTKIIEIKQGPYDGVSKDKAPIEDA